MPGEYSLACLGIMVYDNRERIVVSLPYLKLLKASMEILNGIDTHSKG